MTSLHDSAALLQGSLSASGRSSEKLSLPSLQSKMKCDPEGYESELVLLYNQFKSSMELCQQQAAQNFTSISGVSSDPTVVKSLGDRAMFLAHVAPFYPDHLSEFPKQLAELLRSSARSLPSALRCHVAQSLILLINRQMVDIRENLALFMELQTMGDRALKKLAFSHIIHSIKKMNQKHKNDAKNRNLQNILFSMLQQEDEALVKRSLVTLCELHRRKVWFDDRTANAICTSCFHSSTRIMIATLSFLLDYEKIIDDDGDSDAASSEDDSNPQVPYAVLSREAIYKAHHKGTVSSKKKKKAKLQRAIRSMKKRQRLSSEKNTSDYYSPLNHLKDAQGFVEKLFSRLQSCNERFEIKMMMLKVIARTVGLHHLILLNFYPFLLKYCQPHQRDVTSLLAAAVQTCHDMVPPDAVEPLFKQIVNQFVHDHSRPEAIAVGLNVIREICLRMPLLMTEDLLQDLALYKKSHEKAVSVAARSLIGLFREVCPSLLVKKDRGRPTNPTARPKAYGEVSVVSNVPGVELLQHDSDKSVEDDYENSEYVSENNDEICGLTTSGDECTQDGDYQSEDDESEEQNTVDDGIEEEEEDDDVDLSEDETEEIENEESNEDNDEEDYETDDSQNASENDFREIITEVKDSKMRKRKFPDFDKEIIAADTSLAALKRLTRATVENTSPDEADGILSNEDFKRIKQLKAKAEAKTALAQHGLLKKGSDAKSTAFKIPSSDQLSIKRVDPAKLEFHIRKKLTKEERLEFVRAGREDRGKYQARTAVKQKKTGGMSNRQKEHKKAMPLAAKRSKIAKSRVSKRKRDQLSGKNFRGKKAWK